MKQAGQRVASFVFSGALVLAAVVAFTVGAEAKVLNGTAHADRLIGGRAVDRLNGRAGADVLRGEQSGDTLRGGRGGDRINGGSGFDVAYGGPGGDRIDARDGHRDRIDCGPGNDVVRVDEIEDGVRNCEKVVEP